MQGKYALEIMKRLCKDDYKPMAMPMITNMKKVTTSDLDMVDPTLYKQSIGSLMYMVNIRLDICFAMNTFRQFVVESRKEH